MKCFLKKAYGETITRKCSYEIFSPFPENFKKDLLSKA